LKDINASVEEGDVIHCLDLQELESQRCCVA